MRRTERGGLAVVMVVASLGLGACSGGGSDSPPSAPCTREIIEVNSGSMLPTLTSGDRVPVCVGPFDAKTGDIVAFRRKPTEPRADEPGFSRVVAMEGDHIVIARDELVVNGSVVDYGWNDPVAAPEFSCLLTAEGCTIPAGMVFLIGDNLQGSRDSRLFGPFPVEDVLGRMCRTSTCDEFL
jgi:signal peptidase I